jgi:SAM-dependent methyltransferase
MRLLAEPSCSAHAAQTVEQPPDPNAYILPRSEAELQRLVLQDHLLHSITSSLFERAGLREGMRVLDIGSGAGGVALLAGALVGATGSVVGVEIDEQSVAAATKRAAEAGMTNVTFIRDDIATVVLPGSFDAIVGRLVLMHLNDPTAILAHIRTGLRPDGVMAFLEGVVVAPWLSWPRSPTLEEVQGVRDRVFGHVRVNLHMGLDLRTAFLRAGLGEPDLRAEVPVGAGPNWPGLDLIEETLRSLMPAWTREGVEGADRIVLDGLAKRIGREVGDEGTVMMHPFVGAWVRPGT